MLLLFTIFLAVVAYASTDWTEIVVGVVGQLSSVCLFGFFVYDIWLENSTHRRSYSRNLGIIVLAATMAIGEMTDLHIALWYPQRNGMTFELTKDTVSEVSY